MKIDTNILNEGWILFVSYGNTQIVGRFKSADTTTFYFYDYLHYWNGHEQFMKVNTFCVKSGIVEMRRATLPEKHSLIKFELEHNTI